MSEQAHDLSPSRLPARLSDAGSDVGVTPFAPAGPTPEAKRPIPQVLWRHRWIVVLCVLASLAVAGIYYIYAPRLYRSTAIVAVKENATFSPDTALPTPATDAAKLTVYAEMMQSGAVLREAVAMEEVASTGMLSDLDEAERVEYLKRRLDVKADSDRGLMTISLEGRDPWEVRTVVNAVGLAFVEQQGRNKLSTVEDAARIFKSETGPRRVAELPPPDLAEVAAMQVQTQVESPLEMAARPLSARQITDRIRLLGEALRQAEVEASAAESYYLQSLEVKDNPEMLKGLIPAARIDDARTDGLLDTMDLVRQVERLKQDLAYYRRLGYADRHPMVLSDESRLSELQRQLAERNGEIGRAVLSRLEQEHQAAQRRLSQVQMLLTDYTEVALRYDAIPIAVLDAATVSKEPVSPSLARVVPVAVLLGLLLGGAGAFLQEALDDSAKRAREPEGPSLENPRDIDLGDPSVPLYGTVPLIDRGGSDDAGGAGGLERELTAESIHEIRAVLQVRAEADGSCAFAITSPGRGAGKTSVAVGLASSLALSGTRTLLVDCDLAGRMRRAAADPSAGVAAGAFSDEGGLGSPYPAAPVAGEEGVGSVRKPSSQSVDTVMSDMGYLDGRDAALCRRDTGLRIGVTGLLEGGTFEECIVPATTPGLAILPAINPKPQHIAAMSGRFVRRLIADARDHYDMILFDTGPVPGSVEALLVASEVDGVLIVASRGEPQARFARCISQLQMVGARLAGTVFNRAARGQTHVPRADESPRAGAADRRGKRRGRRGRTAEEEAREMGVEYGSGLIAAAVCATAGVDPRRGGAGEARRGSGGNGTRSPLAEAGLAADVGDGGGVGGVVSRSANGRGYAAQPRGHEAMREAGDLTSILFDDDDAASAGGHDPRGAPPGGGSVEGGG